MKPAFTILGARGTMPVSGAEFAKYGGRTTSFCLKTEDGIILVDAGTGICLLDENVASGGKYPPATLLFTHFHLDHVLALPFLKRCYHPEASLAIMASSAEKTDWRAAVTNLFGRPYWPVSINEVAARVTFADLPAKANAISLYGVLVSWCHVLHPQGCVAYRFDTGCASVAVVTDHEKGDQELDPMLIRLCAKVDFLIYDAQYTPEELAARRGWGHSSWREGAEIARETGAGELILTHHDSQRSDAGIDAIVRHARRSFPDTRAAREGMRLF